VIPVRPSARAGLFAAPLLVCLAQQVPAAPPVTGSEVVDPADPVAIQAAYDSGDYRAVIGALEERLADSAPSIHSPGQIRWLLMHADAYRRLGLHGRASGLLFAVRRDIESQQPQTDIHALYYGRLGEALALAGNVDGAVAAIERGLAIVSPTGTPAVRASLLNELGNAYFVSRDAPRAVANYRSAQSVAQQAGDAALLASTSMNLARALLTSGDAAYLRATLDAGREAVAGMAPGAERLAHLLALGRLYQDAQAVLGFSAEYRVAAHGLLSAALGLADQLGDDRSASFALGYLGSLYEEERSIDDAARLTASAAARAGRASADDALYLWEWQLGRLQRRAGDADAALASYRRAIRAMERIRSALAASADLSRRGDIARLHFEMADLLLQITPTVADAAERRHNLLETRDIIESVKAAEIVEYFDNECVIQAQDRAALEQLSSSAAIVYPVMMPDRLELLLSTADDIEQVTIPVSRADLTRVVREFRLAVEDVSSGDRYLGPARQLYDWLFRPIERDLAAADIDTLVVVPDGALRTIPMSALHDGERFLVEKYALATTPGISLTSADPIERGSVRVLANGITEAVQGFSALPNVEQELDGIGRLYPTRVNQDEAFRLQSVERSLEEGDYSIVHIATHGQFESNYRDSFLLTFDDRMTLNRLEQSLNLRRYREQAIDLLVLSACQTAAGDDRAALGMAGVALKAGARSALATLWFINDASTAELMQDFYANLRDGRSTKAEALQAAQNRLLHTPERRHPAHWAPFLLIGNWL